MAALVQNDPSFEGKHIKGDRGDEIYLVLDLKLRWVVNPTVWEALFGKGTWKFETVPQALVDAYPKGAPLDQTTPLVKGNSDAIYLIDQGRKRWITNPDVYNRYGFSWDVVTFIGSVTELIPSGPNIEHGSLLAKVNNYSQSCNHLSAVACVDMVDDSGIK